MNGLHLIIQYCNDARPDRAAEYDECLRRNLANPSIATVHNLVEDQTIVPDEFKSHEKYKEHKLGRWMTYKDAFEYAAEKLPGQVVALANLDIFLDPAANWQQAMQVVSTEIVLCLSRVEWDKDGKTFLDPGLAQIAFANTQDAWIFKSPLVVANCDFEIGTLGCDNAIAHRIKAAGKLPVNAASQFRIFHYDRARGKSFANQQQVHGTERAHRPRRRPEEEGQYLLPDIDHVKSVDQILTALKVTDMQRYVIICDVMSRFIRIRND